MVSLEEVIKECKQYNKLAQRILYDKYAPVIKGICLRYTGDPEAANDIMQEGFIKVFSQIRQYSGTGSFEGWMKRIFINTTISYLRKLQKNQKHIKLEDIEESTIVLDEPENEFHSNQSSFEVVSSAEFSEEELLNILKKLPEKYRIVFNLHCIENTKHEEIADLLDIDMATSRTRLLRARQLVQKELYAMSIARISIKNKNV